MCSHVRCVPAPWECTWSGTEPVQGSLAGNAAWHAVLVRLRLPNQERFSCALTGLASSSSLPSLSSIMAASTLNASRLRLLLLVLHAMLPDSQI
jgi:hypothetical protein